MPAGPYEMDYVEQIREDAKYVLSILDGERDPDAVNELVHTVALSDPHLKDGIRPTNEIEDDIHNEIEKIETWYGS